MLCENFNTLGDYSNKIAVTQIRTTCMAFIVVGLTVEHLFDLNLK